MVRRFNKPAIFGSGWVAEGDGGDKAAGKRVEIGQYQLFTEDLGDLGTASIPMLLDSGLDQLKVVLGDSSFSDGNGQHSY